MKTKTNVFIKIGALIVAIVMLFTIYIVIVKNKLPKSIEYKSFDGEKSITIDLDSNIKSYDYPYGESKLIIRFKRKNDFVNMVKKSQNYYRLLEYTKEEQKFIEILWYSNEYFYIVKIYDNYATIENLVVDISGFGGYGSFPFPSESLYIEVGLKDGISFGGEVTKSIDELNDFVDWKLEEKLFSNYLELKSFLQMANSDYYQFNDETKTIKIKLYSESGFKNGTNFADGYPVTVQFDETETNVKISVDLSIYQKD